MVVDFQPRGKKDFSTPDGREKPKIFAGPLSALDRDNLSVLILQHVSDSLVPFSSIN